LLFSSTIKENLLVGKSDATLEEMAVALRSA
jgi:ABC-type multidrug transport system fused ATPase/permease subunit